MKHVVYGIIDDSGQEFSPQEVEANSPTEAKLLATAQTGGYWNEDTLVICPENRALWTVIQNVISRKDNEIASLKHKIEQLQNTIKREREDYATLAGV